MIRATAHGAQLDVRCLVLVRQSGSRRGNGLESMPQNGLRGCCHLGTFGCRSRTSTVVFCRERQQQRQLLRHPFRLTERLVSEIAVSLCPSTRIAVDSLSQGINFSPGSFRASLPKFCDRNRDLPDRLFRLIMVSYLQTRCFPYLTLIPLERRCAAFQTELFSCMRFGSDLTTERGKERANKKEAVLSTVKKSNQKIRRRLVKFD